ncbi:glycoside hydrolase family 3 protein [Mucor lusitanicus CBS 277.49]|uniref:Glycoside hydrolase family 3 protein n=2 Tax=Mucor circinelloides f. lusitanicus TaxID=29924 RepID=A0A168IF75_MUCCL|nr:glycoside hydrolase family 3 protein [Mucor lusitanicus CBS 277.49]
MTKTDLQHDVGQLLICGFHGLEATEGILDLIRHHNLGSIIFFSRNIESPEQVQRLTHTLQTAAKKAGHVRPLLIAVDQENGVVRRLGSSGTYLPGSMALGAIDSTSAAYQVATATAKELLALGINWNLAPSMDVNNNALNPVIGVRSFGENPHLVAKLGLAQVEAYHRHHVATSIKHFPGHGDTATDSHLGVPVIDKSLHELEQTELVPFAHCIEAQGDAHPTSVMIGHISLPQIIAEENRPACISSEIATDLLRKKLGYQGIIITDCLEMDAVKDTVGSARGAVMALQAGNDISMLSHTLSFQQDAFKFLGEAVQDGTLDEDALSASLDRVAALKDRFLTWDEALKKQDLADVGCKAHLELSERLYNKVPTVVRDQQQLLPIKPSQNDKILFLAADVPLTLAIDSETEPFNSMYDSLHRRHGNTEYIIFKQETPDLTDTIKSADIVIVGTANGNLHPFQADLVKLASLHAKKLIVIAVINPYDLMAFPSISTYLVTYEYTPPAHEAAIRLIFGEISQSSHLPVTIPNNTGTQAAQEHWKITSYSDQDTKQAHNLWNCIYSKSWPLSFENFALVLSRLQKPRHFCVYTQDALVGFAATQTIEKTGQLALLIVHPDYQNQGIGTRLNDHCLDLFRQEGALRVMLGSSYPRFFCGVPDDDILGQQAQGFFSRRGYTLTQHVWDLMGDIRNYTIPAALTARMEKEGIWFGTIEPTEIGDLIAFQKRYFEYWVSTYEHHAHLGDYQDLVVAREGDKNGNIVGSLILYTTEGSHGHRTDLIWTDDSLFTESSGGMACVGVATEERGRGIGIGLVAYANQTLKERGVNLSYVDWVELIDFYSRTGYQKWRSYRLGAMK